MVGQVVITTLGVVTLPRCTAPVHLYWDRYFFILGWVFWFSGFLLGFFLLGFYMIYSWATLIFLVSEEFLNGIFLLHLSCSDTSCHLKKIT